MDISEQIARLIGFQQIQIIEKDAQLAELQAKLNTKEAAEPEKK